MAKTTSKPTYNLKIIFCGAGGVGKTSVVRRYVENKFEQEYLLTVGMEPSNRIVQIGDHLVNLVIFDVAGQKRFQIMREVFFRGAHGAVFVFDITRPNDSIEELFTWKAQIDKRLEAEIPIILLANKIDLKDEFDFMKIDIEDSITSLGCFKYCETSAKNGDGISEVFEDLSKEILSRQKLL